MANESRGTETITLDNLISATSASVLRTLREQEKDFKINPKIWVGIWIDLDRFGNQGPLGGPGGGPGGGGIG